MPTGSFFTHEYVGFPLLCFHAAFSYAHNIFFLTTPTFDKKTKRKTQRRLVRLIKYNTTSTILSPTMKFRQLRILLRAVVWLLGLLVVCSRSHSRGASTVTAWTCRGEYRYRTRLGSESSNNHKETSAFLRTAVPGPPLDTKPDYENIHGPLGSVVDGVFQNVFRAALAAQVVTVGTADNLPADDDDDYAAIVALAARMNRQYTNRTEIHVRAQTVLRNLFPSWLPVRAMPYIMHWKRVRLSHGCFCDSMP